MSLKDMVNIWSSGLAEAGLWFISIIGIGVVLGTIILVVHIIGGSLAVGILIATVMVIGVPLLFGYWRNH